MLIGQERHGFLIFFLMALTTIEDDSNSKAPGGCSDFFEFVFF